MIFLVLVPPSLDCFWSFHMGEKSSSVVWITLLRVSASWAFLHQIQTATSWLSQVRWLKLGKVNSTILQQTRKHKIFPPHHTYMFNNSTVLHFPQRNLKVTVCLSQSHFSPLKVQPTEFATGNNPAPAKLKSPLSHHQQYLRWLSDCMDKKRLLGHKPPKSDG